MGSIVLGLAVAPVCFFFCTTIKNKLGYDDALDVFGVHCIGGIIGALATGILVDPALGGQGIADYISTPGTISFVYPGAATQLMIQAKAVMITLLWSGGISAVLFFVIDKTIGMRPAVEAEREGLDISEHGERAYNY
jgi:Amt family ammonium transporter